MSSTATNYIINIDETFPVKGKDNSSEGFRSNFKNIKNAIQSVNEQLDLLDQNVIKANSTLTNLFGSTLQDLNLKNYSVSSYDNGTKTGNITIDYSLANYQKLSVSSGEHQLSVINWPASGTAGILTLAILPANTTSASINFANATSLGPQPNPFVLTPNIPNLFEIWKDIDSGTLYIKQLNEYVYSGSTSTNTIWVENLTVGTVNNELNSKHITTSSRGSGMLVRHGSTEVAQIATLPDRITKQLTGASDSNPGTVELIFDSATGILNNSVVYLTANNIVNGKASTTTYTVTTVTNKSIFIVPDDIDVSNLKLGSDIVITNPTYVAQPVISTVTATPANTSTGIASNYKGAIYANANKLEITFGDFGGGTTNTFMASILSDSTDVYNKGINLVSAAFVHNVLPYGSIIAWYGQLTKIPYGWQLCDGTNGTPDLRSKFVIGASADIFDSGTGSWLGAASAITGTLAISGGYTDIVLPAHTHGAVSTYTGYSHTHGLTLTDPGHRHNITHYSNSDNIGQYLAGATSANGSIAQTDTTSTGITATLTNATQTGTVITSLTTVGESGVNKNIPPFYSLYYIMKLTGFKSSEGGGGGTGSAPIINGITPSIGTTAGGDFIQLTGENFYNAYSVKIGNSEVTNVNIASNTIITGRSPAGTAGPSNVTISTPYGTYTAPSLFNYQEPVALTPTISSISPTSGSTVGGETVTINGYNFIGATSVKFGSVVSPQFSAISSTVISCKSPPGTASTVPITVITGAGTSNSVNYVYAAVGSPPTITSIDPTQGTTAGGTALTINGTNFTSGATATVGGSSVTGLQFVNSSKLTGTTPAHVAGNVNVVVTTTYGSASFPFLYVVPSTNPPTISTVSPSSAATTGNFVLTINGNYFLGATSVKVNNVELTSKNITNTQITGTVPAGNYTAGSATITVTTPAGTVTNTTGLTFSSFTESISAAFMNPSILGTVAVPTTLSIKLTYHVTAGFGNPSKNQTITWTVTGPGGGVIKSGSGTINMTEGSYVTDSVDVTVAGNYTVTCSTRGVNDAVLTNAMSITGVASSSPAPTVSVSITPGGSAQTAIKVDTPYTFSYQTTNATSALMTITKPNPAQNVSFQVSTGNFSDVIYAVPDDVGMSTVTIAATGAGGTTSASAYLYVNAADPPTIQLTLPSQAYIGETFTWGWALTGYWHDAFQGGHPGSVIFTVKKPNVAQPQNIGFAQPANSGVPVTPVEGDAGDNIFYIEVQGPGGTVSKTQTISIGYRPPYASIDSPTNGAQVIYGEISTFSWTVENATHAYLNIQGPPGAGQDLVNFEIPNTSGSAPYSPGALGTYVGTITAEGPGGTYTTDPVTFDCILGGGGGA